MQEPLSKYAKVGLAHFMLWPDCVVHDEVLVETLPLILDRSDIEVVDYCLPYDESLRQSLARKVCDSGKEACYVMFHFPFTKISLGSPAQHDQGLCRLVLQNQIDAALASGAKSIVVASGPDPGDADRPDWMRAFASMLQWFCRQLEPHDMTANLESFDRNFDRRFLAGPTAECVELIESLAPGTNNLRLQLDTSHVRLMGESFEHAFHTAGGLLSRLHLANTVMGDSSDPFFGDRHPPLGYPGGEIDVSEVTKILRLLLDAGRLDPRNRLPLVIEIRPWPGRSVDESIEDNMRRLNEAWSRV